MINFFKKRKKKKHLVIEYDENDIQVTGDPCSTEQMRVFCGCLNTILKGMEAHDAPDNVINLKDFMR